MSDDPQRSRGHYRADGREKVGLTESEAERRVAAAGPRELLNAYRCEVCGLWHIGHDPAV